MHLAVRRLSVPPITMGRMPPHFFFRDISVALDRTCLMNSGRSPRKKKLQNSVTDATSWLPASFAEVDTASFRCCGRSPEGPAALPEGKENMAERISLSDTCSCVTSVAGAARRFSGLAGCFHWSLCRFSSLGRVNVSSLAASRTAPRMSPSSGFSRMSFPLSFMGGKNGLFVLTESVYY